jgi:hypothetical protein
MDLNQPRSFMLKLLLPVSFLVLSACTHFGGPAPEKDTPPFQADADSGRIRQQARGCGTSAILNFAADLNPDIAEQWYQQYEQHFWKDNGWLAGFTERPRDSGGHFMDVDSGPVLMEFGSMASLFGIGASKSLGRFDHTAPLTMEAVASCWPTPFGFLLPMIMGQREINAPVLGEAAILFNLTRPTRMEKTTPFQGSPPLLVWGLFTGYAGIGLFLCGYGVNRMAKRLSGKPSTT